MCISDLIPHVSSLSLLAQSRMGDVSQRFREQGTGTGWAGQLWFVLIPVLAIGISLVIYRIYNQPQPILNTPLGMLGELCRVHQLSPAGRRLLERIAEAADLPQPATMLVSTGQFDQAVNSAGKKLRYDRRQRTMLAEIREKLLVG